MVIVETSIFTRRVTQLLSDDEYRELQTALVNQPKAGAVIRASGGIRKLRWSAAGHGKRGGARVIYYFADSQSRVLMLYIYAKNETDDLAPDQIKVLRNIVESEYP